LKQLHSCWTTACSAAEHVLTLCGCCAFASAYCLCASDAYFKKEEKQKAFSFVKVKSPT
jgi:hypothetical protein